MKKIILLIGIIIGYIGFSNITFGYGCMDYGIMAYETLQGTCKCRDGYHFETNPFGGSTCVQDPTCSETYGFGAKDNFDGTCSCRSGYVWGTDMFGKKKCIDGDNVCRDKFGIMSNYDDYSGKCECTYGYEFSKKTYGDGFECKSCSSKYGIHSSYNGLTKSCECDSGYTLKDGKCEEKSNSSYFFLKEYDDNDNKAIVTSFYTQQSYLLELRFTSGLYKAENFVGKKIVINMGTDFNIDIYDKFILNNELLTYDIVTDILDVEEVDEDFTLKTCEDIFGNNVEDTYDNKCRCKSGYKWNYNKTSCELDSLNSYKKTPKYCPDNENGYRGNDGICYCNIGYSFSNIKNKCIKNIVIPISNTNKIICGENSFSNEIGKCTCKVGYEWENKYDNNNLNCKKIKNKILDFNLDEKLKNKIDNIFFKLEKKFNKLGKESQIKKYKALSSKIDKVIIKINKKTTKNILNYLKYLIDDKLKEIN